MKQEQTSLLIAGSPWSVDVWREDDGEIETLIKHGDGYQSVLIWAKEHGTAHHGPENAAGDTFIQIPLDIVDRAVAFEIQAIADFDDDDEPDNAITIDGGESKPIKLSGNMITIPLNDDDHPDKLEPCADCGKLKPRSKLTHYKKWVQNGLGGNCCAVCSITDED